MKAKRFKSIFDSEGYFIGVKDIVDDLHYDINDIEFLLNNLDDKCDFMESVLKAKGYDVVLKGDEWCIR